MEMNFIIRLNRLLGMNPKKNLLDPALIPAAVFLIVYLKDGDYCILLNKRSHLVENHKGEISFPGGRKDESDRTLLDTAFRELWEEMGIVARDVEILGELDDVRTNSNYVVSVFVGTIESSYHFQPDSNEVAQVLEVPIKVLNDVHQDVFERKSDSFNMTTYIYEGHLIHGATAKIIARFLEVINGTEWGSEYES